MLKTPSDLQLLIRVYVATHVWSLQNRVEQHCHAVGFILHVPDKSTGK